MRCIIHEVRRNSNSIATNFEENTTYFSQLEIIRLIQSILRNTGSDSTTSHYHQIVNNVFYGMPNAELYSHPD